MDTTNPSLFSTANAPANSRAPAELAAKAAGGATRWVTREHPKIDRIACPWLVRRFVDADAQFLYVPTAQVRAVAQDQHATPYDVNAGVADTSFTHDGALCSFDAFIKIYRLGSDTALAKLADIVRGADTDRLDLAPQAAVEDGRAAAAADEEDQVGRAAEGVAGARRARLRARRHPGPRVLPAPLGRRP